MDGVFRALADPSRRKLLDRLFKRDGQTLGELCQRVDMTRFGVMKHLRLLEDAGLLTTRKVGREKLHYLNPVPIRLIHDRWVSKYAAPMVEALTRLKSQLEEPMDKPTQVYELFIRTTPEKLWQAITDGAFTRRYFFGTSFQSTLQAGAPYQYVGPEGNAMVEGTIVESDPPRRLVMTWKFLYDPELKREDSRVTWLIEQRGNACKLTAVHELANAPNTAKHVTQDGWTTVLSGLKTFLETGESLDIGQPA